MRDEQNGVCDEQNGVCARSSSTRTLHSFSISKTKLFRNQYEESRLAQQALAPQAAAAKRKRGQGFDKTERVCFSHTRTGSDNEP